MKRFMLLLLVFALSSATACDPAPPGPTSPAATATQTTAQTTAPAPAPAESVEDLVVQKPLLWEIEAADGATSHLIGTYHIGTDFTGLDGLPPAAREAFRGAGVIVLEADTGIVDPSLSELMVLQGPKGLDTMLAPDQWDILLEEVGLPPQQLKRLRPHTVAGILAREWTPNPGVRGMDGRFRILAKAHEKKLVFLETPREQLEIVSDAVTVEMLAETLDNVSQEKAKTQKLLAGFRAGDAEALEAALFETEQVEKHRDFYEEVFWKRNERWVEPLRPLLDGGGAFVAVGAGHLLGERSVPELLQDAGYTVRRVAP